MHLKMIPQPSQPHFSDDASIPSTPHYSGNTKSNSMKASCPPLPRCLGSHTGLLEREPAGGDSPQMSPPPPSSSEPKPSFQGPLLLPRFTGPQKPGYILNQEEDTHLPNSRVKRQTSKYVEMAKDSARKAKGDSDIFIVSC